MLQDFLILIKKCKVNVRQGKCYRRERFVSISVIAMMAAQRMM